MNTRSEGNVTEDMAAHFLESKGYKIIKRNFLCKMGEVDIISISPENNLVFTEVKYRSSDLAGDPLDAVTYAKQKKICKTSLVFISKNPRFSDLQVRYDVIGIYRDFSIKHIENAFSYEW